MEIIIDNFMDITEYLKQCKVGTVDDLSAEQVLAWAKAGKMGLTTELSVDIVENGLYGVKPDYNLAIKMIKQAIKENKAFYCSYIEQESCEGPVEDESSDDDFDMYIR